MAKRHKTKYPGVFYRMVNRRAKPGKQQKVFYIVFKVDGKVIEEKTGLQYEDAMTAAKASRIRAQRIEKRRLSPKQRREQKKWTFETLWQEYVRQRGGKISSPDKSRFNVYLSGTIGNKRPDDIEPKHVDKIRMENLAEKSNSTIHHTLALINRLANFGSDKGLSKGLTFRIKKPRVNNNKTECLTQDELRRFLSVLDSNPGDVAASLKMALFSGMRRGEILKLEWRDIDFELGFILLRDPKGGKDERIPLNSAARKVLEKQSRDRRRLFGNKTPENFYQQAVKLKIEAGLPEDFRVYHGLRHTYASMLASSGKVDMYVLQRLMTHKDPKMTQRYAHLRDAALKAGSDVASDIFGGDRK